MEIVPESTHRLLAYVGALNQQGVNPHPSFVEEFATQPDRKSESAGGLNRSLELLKQTILFGPPSLESAVDHMYRLGWAHNDRGVALTVIGRALLKALNAPAIEDLNSDVFEFVLDKDNPFAYAQTIGALSNIEDGLLVDPYFRLEQLLDIAELDNVTRILIGTRLKKAEYEALSHALAAIGEQRAIEVRKAGDLHDRYLIPRTDGQALMLGCSIGGIGKKVSTLTTLSTLSTRALRDAHETIWDDAEPVRPKGDNESAAQAAPSAPVDEVADSDVS